MDGVTNQLYRNPDKKKNSIYLLTTVKYVSGVSGPKLKGML